MKGIVFAWILAYSGLSQAFLFGGPDAVDLDDARLSQSHESWDLLIPDRAYDWVPEDPSLEQIYSIEFQEKLETSGAMIDPTLDGRAIELGGFMVPLELDGDDVVSFLVVPEAGQCIHVPPPPINQTLFVDATLNPVKLRDLYQPIWVSGVVRSSLGTTDLADYGYRLIDPSVVDLIIPDYDPLLVPRHQGD